MCRWIANAGADVFLETFVPLPRQPLVAQSQNARLSRTDVAPQHFVTVDGERIESTRVPAN